MTRHRHPDRPSQHGAPLVVRTAGALPMLQQRRGVSTVVVHSSFTTCGNCSATWHHNCGRGHQTTPPYWIFSTTDSLSSPSATFRNHPRRFAMSLTIPQQTRPCGSAFRSELRAHPPAAYNTQHAPAAYNTPPPRAHPPAATTCACSIQHAAAAPPTTCDTTPATYHVPPPRRLQHATCRCKPTNRRRRAVTARPARPRTPSPARRYRARHAARPAAAQTPAAAWAAGG